MIFHVLLSHFWGVKIFEVGGFNTPDAPCREVVREVVTGLFHFKEGKRHVCDELEFLESKVIRSGHPGGALLLVAGC